jgi:hypothetical protein
MQSRTGYWECTLTLMAESFSLMPLIWRRWIALRSGQHAAKADAVLFAGNQNFIHSATSALSV